MSDNHLNILFVSAECLPFCANGGVSDMCYALSKYISRNENYDVRVVLPYYTLIPEEYKVKIKENTTILTSIEFEIFNLLVQNYGIMVSPKKILTDVWGYDEDDDIVETIRVHIKHIRSKIEKISKGKKYIKTTYRGGYTLYPEGIEK